MRGTLHHSFVLGGAAVMALVDGQKRRALEAYAQAQAGATPVYRAFAGSRFAYVSAIVGDCEQAMSCMQSIAEVVRTLEARSSHSLWVQAFLIGACVMLSARGVAHPSLREWLDEHVRRLDRIGHRRPDTLRLLHEGGRMALGRSSLAALTEAKRRSLETWSREGSMAGHPDGCMIATLALQRAAEPACRAAAPSWSEEALALVAERYPAAFTARVRELLSQPVIR